MGYHRYKIDNFLFQLLLMRSRNRNRSVQKQPSSDPLEPFANGLRMSSRKDTRSDRFFMFLASLLLLKIFILIISYLLISLVSEGREKITVIQGPSGMSLRLHKGNGRLPSLDLSKPFAKKCRNRECTHLGGQVLYCR